MLYMNSKKQQVSGVKLNKALMAEVHSHKEKVAMWVAPVAEESCLQPVLFWIHAWLGIFVASHSPSLSVPLFTVIHCNNRGTPLY